MKRPSVKVAVPLSTARKVVVAACLGFYVVLVCGIVIGFGVGVPLLIFATVSLADRTAQRRARERTR